MNIDWRAVRAWLYSAIVAAGPLVIFYGLASSDEVALWIGLGGTLLGSSAGAVAVSNLTPKVEEVAMIEVEETGIATVGRHAAE